MPRQLLTDISVRSLKAATRTDYWDTTTPGFGVRVGARDKTFVAKVHNRRHTLGTYGQISLAEARKKALALKSAADPTPAAKLTFSEAYEKFKIGHLARKRPRTSTITNGCLINISCPSWQRRHWQKSPSTASRRSPTR